VAVSLAVNVALSVLLRRKTMQHETRNSKPLSFAFVFMSLAIVPFSLKALGLDPGFSPTNAVNGLRRMAGVLSSAYVPGATVLWDSPAPTRDEAAPQRDVQAESPLIASAGSPSDLADLAVMQGPELTCSSQAAETRDLQERAVRRALKKAVRDRQPALRSSSKAAELPIRMRLLAEVLQKTPVEASLLMPARLSNVDPAALRRVRLMINDSMRRLESQKDMKVLLKFEVPRRPAGAIGCPPPPNTQRRA
jgi:hypothetical protein